MSKSGHVSDTSLHNLPLEERKEGKEWKKMGAPFLFFHSLG